MNAPQISILVVDDNEDMTSMLARIIDGEPDMACVGTLACADELVETIARVAPSVALLDLTMPGRNPLEAMAEASARFPQTRIIVLSGHDDPARIDEAIDRGAWGFVAKHSDVQQVLAAVRAVASGELYPKVPNP